jgi:hypothetical protein
MTSINNFIIKDEDYNFLQKTSESRSLLQQAEELGYEITPELVEEMIEIGDLPLEEEEKVVIRFYVKPKEKNRRFGKVLTDKVDYYFGGKHDAIAYSYYKKQNFVRQITEGLVLKRITVPRYVANLVRTHDIINCQTIKEIKDF